MSECTACQLCNDFYEKTEDYLYLTRAGVYTKHDRQVNELFSSSHIYKVEHLCVALLDNGTWKTGKQRIRYLSIMYTSVVDSKAP